MFLIGALAVSCLAEEGPSRLENTVVLDAVGVQHLGIETAEAAEESFEETFVALGHIEVLPGKRSVISSRIPGRAFSVLALPDQQVQEGDELVWVESRQPGDPPPQVMLPAPMSGLIAKVNIAPGQPVSPDDSLIEIVDLSVVEAAARVPEHLAGGLKKGVKARIRVSAFAQETFEAELAHLGVYADGEAGTVEAAFHVANKDLRLRPGMRAEFSIVTKVREGALAIPRAALLGSAGARFVFIKDYELENAFVKLPVEAGVMNDKFVEIKQGLLPGDEVVVRGGYSLSFAGKGSVSLKEALDAAHGHPHNEDGTEMTKEQLAASGGSAAGGGMAGRHSHWNTPTLFFAATTGILLMLLVALSMSWGKSKA
jgi:membrane fusion protein, heavy metal efflux system